MKDDMQFDGFIKDQFKDYSPEVPGHIWENIAARRRSKPKGFWMNWFSGGNLLMISLILLFGGGAAYFIFSSAKNTGNKQIVSDNASIAKPIKDNASEKVKETISESGKEDKITGVKESNAYDPSTDPTVNTSSNTPSANLNTSNSKHLFSSFLYKKIKNKNINEEDKSIAGNEDDVSLQDQTQSNNILVTSKLTFPFIVDNARELSGTKTLNAKNLMLPDCPALEKNAAGNKKYWEVYAGPDYAFSSFKTYNDTASANYLQKRKASTKFSSAFSAGVRYTKVFSNGMSARTGINYSQINEKFQYFNPNEIKYVTVITTRVIVRSPGDTLYINDTLQYQQTGTRIKTTYNRYRNIDIPIVIGYEFGNGKIHANINAGVIINIYSWYKGDLLDSSYQPVSITTGKGNSVYQFKNNIGVGFLGGVSLYYKLTENIHLLLEPYFRYNLSPMSKANLNLQQKYNIAGVRAGVRFDLK